MKNNEFTQITNEVLVNLKKTEDVNILDQKEQSKVSYLKDSKLVWTVKTFIRQPSGTGKEILLFLSFDEDFPASFPETYVSEEFYDDVKYIPHLDTNRLVCTFDRPNTVTNHKDPLGIVREVIRRAKSTLEQGLSKSNIKDFEEEFLSYWENNYEKESEVRRGVISFITESPSENEIKLLVLGKKINGIKHIIIQNNIESENFINYLKERRIEYEVKDIFYIDKDLIGNHPPFNIKVKESLEIYENFNINSIDKFLNRKESPKLVIFKKNLNGTIHYIGWSYPTPTTEREGFRKGIITPLVAFKSFNSNEHLIRISPQSYTQERINFRSEGNNQGKKALNFCIAGVGSIGSHLIHFLESFKLSSYFLVDPDTLSIENTGRHFLGFNDLFINKAEAMKRWLINKDPRRSVQSNDNSILRVINSSVDKINDSDYLFLIIGKQDIEEVLFEKIENGEVTCPLFIIWVEPYLLGGHCLYIHPNDIKHDEFYENIDGVTLYKNNIIHSEEYLNQNEVLNKKEASCQSSFMPYSESEILKFLSNLFIEIEIIIKNKSQKSKGFTWVGDLELLKKLNLKGSKTKELVNKSHSIIEFG